MTNIDESVLPEGLTDEWKEFLAWHLNHMETLASRIGTPFDHEKKCSYVRTLLEHVPNRSMHRIVELMSEIDELVYGGDRGHRKPPTLPTGPKFLVEETV